MKSWPSGTNSNSRQQQGYTDSVTAVEPPPKMADFTAQGWIASQHGLDIMARCCLEQRANGTINEANKSLRPAAALLLECTTHRPFVDDSQPFRPRHSVWLVATVRVVTAA
jgi:hypothetical protein